MKTYLGKPPPTDYLILSCLYVGRAGRKNEHQNLTSSELTESRM